MKTIAALVLIASFGAFAAAQNSTPPAQPEQAVAAPTQPAAAAAPAAQPAAKASIDELRKKHIDAIGALKKKNIDELNAYRETLKGKSPEEKRKAIEAKKAEFKAAIKALQAANKAEIDQLRKDIPKPAKKDLMEKVKAKAAN